MCVDSRQRQEENISPRKFKSKFLASFATKRILDTRLSYASCSAATGLFVKLFDFPYLEYIYMLLIIILLTETTNRCFLHMNSSKTGEILVFIYFGNLF